MSPRDKSAKQQEKAAQKAGDEAAQHVKDETGVGDKPPSDPDELRREISETREELGDTVAELSEKADVKAQVKQTVSKKQDEAKARASEIGGKVASAPPVQQAKERPAVAIGAALGIGLLIGFLLRRR